MSTKRNLIFIAVFFPALIFYLLGMFVTASRLAWNAGNKAAVKLLAARLAANKESK
jgi:hypothetical protein